MLFLYPWQPAAIGGSSIAGAYRPNPNRAAALHPRPDGFGAFPSRPAAPAPDATFVIAHGLDRRVWTQTAADQPPAGEHAANLFNAHAALPPANGSGRNMIAAADAPFQPARPQLRHTRWSGANAQNTTKTKKIVRQPRPTQDIYNKTQDRATKTMPEIATASHSLATAGHSPATASHATANLSEIAHEPTDLQQNTRPATENEPTHAPGEAIPNSPEPTENPSLPPRPHLHENTRYKIT